MNENTEDLLQDLLCKQAVYGLNEEEMVTLRRLGGNIEGADAVSLEATAAMIAMAGLDNIEPLPSHLFAKIEDAADEHLDSSPDTESGFSGKRSTIVPPVQGNSFTKWLGWAVAAAACVALAFNIYVTRNRPVPVAKTETSAPAPVPLTAAQKRERLVQTAPDLTRASLSGGKNFQQVEGDIVWSDQLQEGYARVRGLPANDPSRETYQLWLFEENQGDKTPIDGGTFDLQSNGEVIVPLSPRLKARNPSMFAVTVEKPGGAVVSKREKVAAIAKTET